MTPADGIATLPRVTLVLGGARSGKSRHAETLVEAQPGACIYIATAEAGDAEMAERIRRHRARRGERWSTIEAPLELASAIAGAATPSGAVMVDCLTLWLSNLMAAGRAPGSEVDALVASLADLRGPVVFVSNEVGQGIVPMNALAREFRDAAGLANQAIAAAAQSVVLMVAGLPLAVKSPP